ncbi:MAG: hypothetical protein AAF478_03790 [Pseudomonadota bacterium]
MKQVRNEQKIDQFSPLRQAVRQVRQQLEDEFEAGSTTGRNTDFAQLYFFTTLHWLEHAENNSNSEILYLLVDEFFRYYKIYVMDIENNVRFSAKHWEYHLYCRKLSCMPYGQLFRAGALLFGIRAHIRHDLAEAIYTAIERYHEIHGKHPDIGQFQSMIYGPGSDKVFTNACIDYFECCHVGSNYRRLLKTLAKFSVPIWLRALQANRRAAWKEAIHSLQSNVPINRPKVRLKLAVSHE